MEEIQSKFLISECPLKGGSAPPIICEPGRAFSCQIAQAAGYS